MAKKKDEKKADEGTVSKEAPENTREKGSPAAEDARQAGLQDTGQDSPKSPDIKDPNTVSLRPIEGEEVPDVTAEDRAETDMTKKDGLATVDEVEQAAEEDGASEDGEDSDRVASKSSAKSGSKTGSKTAEKSSLSSLSSKPRVEEDPEPKTVTHSDVNAVDKVLNLVIDEIQKRFDDRVPVAVLKFLVPHITALVKSGELDARARLQVQARFDDALRKLGMI